MTEAQFNSALAIYNPNGGYKTGKIYDITPNAKDFTVIGGGGTRFNENGLVENIIYNKVGQSNSLYRQYGTGNNDHNAGIAPDGTMTATRWSGTNNSSVPKGLNSNLSVYVKAESGTGNPIIGFQNTAGTKAAGMFVNSGTLYGQTGITSTITNVGNGWYRFSVAIPNDNETYYLGVSNAAITDTFFLWGLQSTEGVDLKPLQVTGAAAFPKIDYSTGEAAFLIEPTRTNYEWQSYNLPANTSWGTPTNGTAILNEVGITGEANTALTLSDTSTSGYGEISRTLMPLTLGNYKLSVWVKKDNNESRFPEFFIQFRIGGVSTNSLLQLNTKTGVAAIRAAQTYDQLEYHIIDRGSWWEIVWIAIATDRLATFVIRPALSNTLAGAVTNSLTGSIIIGHVGVYNSTVVDETPIITNGAVVTRTAKYGHCKYGGEYSIDDNWAYAELELLNLSATIIQQPFGMDGDPTMGTVRAAYSVKWDGTQWLAYMRPSNTVIETVNTGITTPRIKVAMCPKKGKIIINGTVFTASTTTTGNRGFSEVTIGNVRQSDSWQNAQSHVRFFDIRLLSSDKTEAEMIALTTL